MQRSGDRQEAQLRHLPRLPGRPAGAHHRRQGGGPGEALKPEFKTYQQQIVKNAAVLAQTIMEGGLDLVSNGTDNHLMLVDLRPAHLTGKEMEHRLDEVYITVNKNAIPNDPEKPFVTSGIRVGTPAVTSRGFTEEDMKVVGRLICQAAQDDFASKVDDLRAQ